MLEWYENGMVTTVIGLTFITVMGFIEFAIWITITLPKGV